MQGRSATLPLESLSGLHGFSEEKVESTNVDAEYKVPP